MLIYGWLSLFVFRPLNEKQKKKYLRELCASAVKCLIAQVELFYPVPNNRLPAKSRSEGFRMSLHRFAEGVDPDKNAPPHNP